MIKLYDSALSGNCHKVRMLLSFLHLQYEKIPVNWAAGEHLSDTIRALNPRAQLPILSDDEHVIWDSLSSSGTKEPAIFRHIGTS